MGNLACMEGSNTPSLDEVIRLVGDGSSLTVGSETGGKSPRNHLLLWRSRHGLRFSPADVSTLNDFESTDCCVLLHIQTRGGKERRLGAGSVCGCPSRLLARLAAVLPAEDISTPLLPFGRTGGGGVAHEASGRRRALMNQVQVYVWCGVRASLLARSLSIGKGWQLRQALSAASEDGMRTLEQFVEAAWDSGRSRPLSAALSGPDRLLAGWKSARKDSPGPGASCAVCGTPASSPAPNTVLTDYPRQFAPCPILAACARDATTTHVAWPTGSARQRSSSSVAESRQTSPLSFEPPPGSDPCCCPPGFCRPLLLGSEVGSPVTSPRGDLTHRSLTPVSARGYPATEEALHSPSGASELEDPRRVNPFFGRLNSLIIPSPQASPSSSRPSSPGSSRWYGGGFSLRVPSARRPSQANLYQTSPTEQAEPAFQSSFTGAVNPWAQHNGLRTEGMKRQDKLLYFAQHCTQLTDYMCVGGKQVAQDLAKLKANGITHVLNCAGDICDNYFEGEFEYMKLYILDSPNEDLTCVLYDAYEYIDRVRRTGGRVFVHCQQGVSRSTVMCIAYLMLFENKDYTECADYVRERRGICRPNVGFMCQLLAWRKRCTGQSHRPASLYRIAPHCSRDRRLVAKWVDRVESAALDVRGVFVLHASERIYLWIGHECRDPHGYLEQAALLISRLQKHERAPLQVVTLYSDHTIPFSPEWSQDGPEVTMLREGMPLPSLPEGEHEDAADLAVPPNREASAQSASRPGSPHCLDVSPAQTPSPAPEDASDASPSSPPLSPLQASAAASLGRGSGPTSLAPSRSASLASLAPLAFGPMASLQVPLTLRLTSSTGSLGAISDVSVGAADDAPVQHSQHHEAALWQSFWRHLHEHLYEEEEGEGSMGEASVGAAPLYNEQYDEDYEDLDALALQDYQTELDDADTDDPPSTAPYIKFETPDSGVTPRLLSLPTAAAAAAAEESSLLDGRRRARADEGQGQEQEQPRPPSSLVAGRAPVVPRLALSKLAALAAEGDDEDRAAFSARMAARTINSLPTASASAFASAGPLSTPAPAPAPAPAPGSSSSGGAFVPPTPRRLGASPFSMRGFSFGKPAQQRVEQVAEEAEEDTEETAQAERKGPVLERVTCFELPSFRQLLSFGREDLSEDHVLLLAVETLSAVRLHVWRGRKGASPLPDDEYAEAVKAQFLEHSSGNLPPLITVRIENVGAESADFWECFR